MIFTPFGSPVEPEVYCKNASDDRSTTFPTESSVAAEASFGRALSVTTHCNLSGQRESSPVSLALIAEAYMPEVIYDIH